MFLYQHLFQGHLLQQKQKHWTTQKVLVEDLLRCSALFLAQAIAIQLAFFYKMIQETNASSVLKYRLVIGLVIGLSIDEAVQTAIIVATSDSEICIRQKV